MVGRFSPLNFFRMSMGFFKHIAVTDTIVLTFLYLGLYCLLGLQFRIPPFLNAGLFLLLFMSFSFLLTGVWLTKFPLGLILKKKIYQTITIASLFLSFFLLALTTCVLTLGNAVRETLPWKNTVSEHAFLWGTVTSSAISASIGAFGLHMIRRHAQLAQQNHHYRTAAEQQAWLREVFDTIHRTQDRDVVCKNALQAALEITRAESACIIPYHAEAKRFGAPLACLPALAEPSQFLPALAQPLPDEKTAHLYQAETLERQGIALPISLSEKPIAFLIIPQPEFSPLESNKRALLQLLCKQTAIALSRIQLQSEKKREEERFSVQLHLTKTLAENLGLGVFVTRDNGELAFINPTAETLLGWSRAEVRNKPFLPLIKAPSLHENPGNALTKEELFTRKDGGTFPVFCAAAPIPLGSDRQVTLYIFHDLSRQKQYEQKLKRYAQRLKQSNRDLEQFAYLASHDLQAPLVKMQRFSTLLEQKNGADAETRDIARRIQDSAQRMQELIQNILTLAQAASTSHKTFVPVDLNQLVQQVLKDLEEKMTRLNARVHIGQMAVIEGQPQLLRILVHNLLDNALKFHRADVPTEIWIACQVTAPNLCRLRIKDNGIGFPENQAERIFKMFERLHGANKYQGNGIGLSLCKRIAEQHLGSITAYSMVNQGATFTVTLPVKHNRA
jgi:PAS domain S-box-containing protein